MEPDDIIDSLIEGVDVEEVDEVASTALKPKSRREIEGIVQSAIDDAVSFVEGEISHQRIKAQRYYDGEGNLGHEQGRSGVVATNRLNTRRKVKRMWPGPNRRPRLYITNLTGLTDIAC